MLQRTFLSLRTVFWFRLGKARKVSQHQPCKIDSRAQTAEERKKSAEKATLTEVMLALLFLCTLGKCHMVQKRGGLQIQ